MTSTVPFCLLLVGLIALACYPKPPSPASIQAAVASNDVSYVKAWLSRGGNPNTIGDDGSLLSIATGPKGGIEVLTTLLEAGANPNVTASYPPLMNAASWVCVRCVELLLQHGVDPAIRTSDGKSAIDVVGRGGGDEVKVKELLAQAANARTPLQ